MAVVSQLELHEVEDVRVVVDDQDASHPRIPRYAESRVNAGRSFDARGRALVQCIPGSSEPPFFRMKTFTPKPEHIERRWYVVDGDGVVLGRLATHVASVA